MLSLSWFCLQFTTLLCEASYDSLHHFLNNIVPSILQATFTMASAWTPPKDGTPCWINVLATDVPRGRYRPLGPSQINLANVLECKL